MDTEERIAAALAHPAKEILCQQGYESVGTHTAFTRNLSEEISVVWHLCSGGYTRLFKIYCGGTEFLGKDVLGKGEGKDRFVDPTLEDIAAVEAKVLAAVQDYEALIQNMSPVMETIAEDHRARGNVVISNERLQLIVKDVFVILLTPQWVRGGMMVRVFTAWLVNGLTDRNGVEISVVDAPEYVRKFAAGF